jgi:hypothetical protein
MGKIADQAICVVGIIEQLDKGSEKALSYRYKVGSPQHTDRWYLKP